MNSQIKATMRSNYTLATMVKIQNTRNKIGEEVEQQEFSLISCQNAIG